MGRDLKVKRKILTCSPYFSRPLWPLGHLSNCVLSSFPVWPLVQQSPVSSHFPVSLRPLRPSGRLPKSSLKAKGSLSFSLLIKLAWYGLCSNWNVLGPHSLGTKVRRLGWGEGALTIKLLSKARGWGLWPTGFPLL